uniref:FAD dependent oxidoreductase n=1 Tax=Candidatus Kentrum sp. LFY TaxID=2126342 RepID=A0A450U6B4_9GAMM|nr:MAG: FAD dependent oxidoreductase [Candidatus Kentron sp. LFY]
MSSKSAVVIGAGVIGSFTAYYPNEEGWDITMVEKEEFGHGSSYGNFGSISSTHMFPSNMPGMDIMLFSCGRFL